MSIYYFAVILMVFSHHSNLTTRKIQDKTPIQTKIVLPLCHSHCDQQDNEKTSKIEWKIYHITKNAGDEN